MGTLGFLLIALPLVFTYRSECHSHWGCSPRIYGDVYEDLICDALSQAWGVKPKLFIKNIWPRSRKKARAAERKPKALVHSTSGRT